MGILTRYWLEFRGEDTPFELRNGCGVTAYDLDDALSVIQKRVLRGHSLPPVAKVIPGVDVTTLDAGHIRTNMGSPSTRGVWYPMGFEAEVGLPPDRGSGSSKTVTNE